MSKERLAAFSDAIIAIIMTILVLELEKPASLTWKGLWELRGSFIAFAVSFFGLAVTWADWNKEWQRVEAISGRTVWSMITVLFFMAFVPYATGLIAQDIMNPVPQILYGFLVTGFTFANCLSYHSLALIDENRHIRNRLTARAKTLAVNVVIMLVCMVLSFLVLPYISMIGIVIISVIFTLPKKDR